MLLEGILIEFMAMGGTQTAAGPSIENRKGRKRWERPRERTGSK
jgi:hypothetical protein